MAKVLVVDDSVSVRKVVAKALEGRSMEVLSAASGREAIESIERDRPDLVVCDVILPDKDGYQVCEFVRAHPAVGRTPVYRSNCSAMVCGPSIFVMPTSWASPLYIG